MEITPQTTLHPVQPVPRELSATIRRWTRDLACLRTRAAQLARKPEAAASPVHEVLADALSLATELLRELAGAELEIQRCGADASTERQRTDYLFDRMPTPCVGADDNGLITRANRAAALLLNVSARHLVGQPLLLFTVDRENVLNVIRRTREDRVQVQCELILRPRERGAIPAAVTLLPRGPGNTTEWLWFLTPERLRPAVAS